VKRHEHLQPLSREHHQALVLARALLGVSDLDAREKRDLTDRVCQAYRREIEPHFAVEDRELLALSACGPAELRAHADRIREEHARLRDLFRAVEREGAAGPGPALGELLTAHVRFEEREWFPALERGAATADFAALAWRLQRQPTSRIEDYGRDEDGVWFAVLDCGHPQHIRHAPPFFQAEWVTTPAGRAARLGEQLRCPLCLMPRAPACLSVYKETPEFDERTLPAGLRRTHTTRTGTWARIQVLAGRVHYVIESPTELQFELKPGVDGIVAPAQPHRVALRPGARMKVSFCRPTPG